MDRITIVIETGNAAFADDFGTELSRVLSKLSSQAQVCECAGDMIGRRELDSNGNKVGAVFGDVGAPSV